MKKLKLLVLVGLMALALAVAPSQANFVQCPGGTCGNAEGTTDNADLINGTPEIDDILAQGGDDVVMSGDGDDTISGNEGNDLLFASRGNDIINGDEGNDLLFTGPDNGDPSDIQEAHGGIGNDVFSVFAGEIFGCLFIEDTGGFDTVNLLGFGPYSASIPFGIPSLGDEYVFVIDPITNGAIAIDVYGDDDSGIERINGLASDTIIFQAPSFIECELRD